MAITMINKQYKATPIAMPMMIDGVNEVGEDDEGSISERN